jgi:hypothetical protein
MPIWTPPIWAPPSSHKSAVDRLSFHLLRPIVVREEDGTRTFGLFVERLVAPGQDESRARGANAFPRTPPFWRCDAPNEVGTIPSASNEESISSVAVASDSPPVRRPWLTST